VSLDALVGLGFALANGLEGVGLRVDSGRVLGSARRRCIGCLLGDHTGRAVLAPPVAGEPEFLARSGLPRLHVTALAFPNAVWHRCSVRETDEGATGAPRSGDGLYSPSQTSTFTRLLFPWPLIRNWTWCGFSWAPSSIVVSHA